MTENTLFTPDTNVDNTELDPNKNYVEELVGEGKKFKTIEDLARGKFIADQHIKTVLAEKDELRSDFLRLREEYNARQKLEELLLNQGNNKQNTDDDDNPKSNKDNPPAIDKKDIESLIADEIRKNDVNKKATQNLTIVHNKLRERFGDNFSKPLQEQISRLDISAEEAESLAKRSPTAFFRMLGLDEQKQDTFDAPPHSSTRNDSFAPKVVKRNWAYWQKMRREQPTEYHSIKSTIQRDKDALEQREAFYA